MSKLAKLTWIALAFVTMIGLSACYPNSYSTDEGNLREFTITTADGRIVPCVSNSVYTMDCDWSRAKVPTFSTPTPEPTSK